MFKLSIFQKRARRRYTEPSDPLFEEILESTYRDMYSISMDKSYKKNLKLFLSDINLPNHFNVSREKFIKTKTYCIRLTGKISEGDFLIRKFFDGYFTVVRYQDNKIFKCDGIQGVKQVLYKVKKDINLKIKMRRMIDELSHEWELRRQLKNNQ